MIKRFVTSLLFVLGLFQFVQSHGYLKDPPARNYMWKAGFETLRNYNYNQLWCGGRQTFIEKKGCGVCGDPIGAKQKHADGGMYATGTTGRSYRQGQVIQVDADLTAGHKGHMEFRISAFGTRGDKTGKLYGDLLETIDGKKQIPVTGQGIYSAKLKLPKGLTCARCVLQWWYKTGNNWGCDVMGCGIGRGDKQEVFVNCADVSIE